MIVVRSEVVDDLRFGSRRSMGAGPITQYRLSPKELEEFNLRCPPLASSSAPPLCRPNPLTLAASIEREKAATNQMAGRAQTLVPESAPEEVEYTVSALPPPLRRANYLALRQQGQTPEQIEKDFGFTHRTLRAMRGKWRLLTEEDETAALAALDTSVDHMSDSTEPTAPVAAVAAVDQSQECPGPSADESCVMIQIPLRAIHQWIEGTGQKIIPATKLHRNESLLLSFDLVLEALGGSWMELEDLLGDSDILVHLQGYIDRKLAVHLKK